MSWFHFDVSVGFLISAGKSIHLSFTWLMPLFQPDNCHSHEEPKGGSALEFSFAVSKSRRDPQPFGCPVTTPIEWRNFFDAV